MFANRLAVKNERGNMARSIPLANLDEIDDPWLKEG
jgi:hypothetical protein